MGYLPNDLRVCLFYWLISSDLKSEMKNYLLFQVLYEYYKDLLMTVVLYWVMNDLFPSFRFFKEKRIESVMTLEDITLFKKHIEKESSVIDMMKNGDVKSLELMTFFGAVSMNSDAQTFYEDISDTTKTISFIPDHYW